MRKEVLEKLGRSLILLYENAYPGGVVYPIQPTVAIRRLTKCRCISYASLAEMCGKTETEISRLLGSSDGCTNYDPRRDRYLVALNLRGRSHARMRWTAAHELGHIAAEHFIELVNSGKTEANPRDLPVMEEEADYFAASFLAPIPAMRELRARSASDIRILFDLSQTAAEYRWAEYQRRKDEPDAIDAYFRRHRARSEAMRVGKPVGKPIDVWADGML